MTKKIVIISGIIVLASLAAAAVAYFLANKTHLIEECAEDIEDDEI